MRILNPDFEMHFNNEEYAVAATDAKGNVISANQHFQKLTGYTLDELKALAYQDITPEYWMIYENQMVIKHAFSQGHAYYQKEYIHRTGEIIPIEIDVYLLDEQTFGVSGIWAKVKRLDILADEYLEIKKRNH